ncbi:alpha-glucosidase C-terminal domain-containing protein [Massilia sp. H-1]|nr:alpha-glucosidase C-terminal domain-containing protein [Massilia sp. H-1]
MRSGAPGLLMYWRSSPEQRILVAVNLSDAPCAAAWTAFGAHQLLYARAVDGASMGPFGCAIAKA